MSRRAHDDEQHDVKPFDCVSSGQVYRDFKNAALRHLAGTVDESGSSLADHAIDVDMGGAAAGAPALPPVGQATQRTKMVRLRTVRSKKLFVWLVRHLSDESTCKMLGDDVVTVTEFLGVISSVLWPAGMTRPDVSFGAGFLACFNNCAGKAHMAAGFDMVGYLVKTKHVGITYGGKLKMPFGLNKFPDNFFKSRGLYTYSDSSWGRSPRPFGGYAVFRLNAALFWKAMKLKIVPDSTCEAETAIGSKAAKATAAARITLTALRRAVYGSTQILIDNKAMMDVITKPGQTARTNHFERATMVIKWLYMHLVVKPYLILTTYMVADIFTKALPAETFVRMRDRLMNVKPTTVVYDDNGNRVTLHGKAVRLWAKLMDAARV